MPRLVARWQSGTSLGNPVDSRGHSRESPVTFVQAIQCFRAKSMVLQRIPWNSRECFGQHQGIRIGFQGITGVTTGFERISGKVSGKLRGNMQGDPYGFLGLQGISGNLHGDIGISRAPGIPHEIPGNVPGKFRGFQGISLPIPRDSRGCSRESQGYSKETHGIPGNPLK